MIRALLLSSIGNLFSSDSDQENLEIGGKQIPSSDLSSIIGSVSRQKEEAKIPWALGRSLFTYFYSGEAAKILLNYHHNTELKKELSDMRKHVNGFVVRLTGVSVAAQLENYCQQQRKYQRQKLERATGDNICTKCRRRCKDATDRRKHEKLCRSNLIPQKGRLKRTTCLDPKVTHMKKKKIDRKIINHYQAGLEVRIVAEKSRSIFTLRKFKKNDFVCVYGGECIGSELSYLREKKYQKEQLGSYLFFFKHKGSSLCYDATEETSNFGRLINHSRKNKRINVAPRVIEVSNKPHVVFFATREIERCSELFYNYGENRRAVLQAFPWMQSS